MYSLIEEFVDLFIPITERNKHYPVDMDEVYQNQARPSQRRLLDQAEFDSPKEYVIKSFMKKEAYGKPTDPSIYNIIIPISIYFIVIRCIFH